MGDTPPSETDPRHTSTHTPPTHTHTLDEATLFGCFAGLMQHMRSSFLPAPADSTGTGTGTGMGAQLAHLREMVRRMDPVLDDYLQWDRECDGLLFCYRWLLVLFRREFEGRAGDLWRVWDVLLAAEAQGAGGLARMRLCVALAMLWSARDAVMAQCSRFEEVLTVGRVIGAAHSPLPCSTSTP